MMTTMMMENTSKTTTTTKTAGIKDTDDGADDQQQPLDTTSILLFAFFEGTANTLKPATTQIGLFASACQAIDVSRYANVKNAIKASSAAKATKKFKICFDGCGVTNGTMGALFAIGLDEQCTRVIDIVDDIIKLYNNNNANVNVKIVAVGLSRGGIACCKLALQLQSYINKNRDREEQQQQQTSSSSESSIIITLSMLLFDPVPGNAIVTKFPFTAIMSQNLSNCNCLKRVLALYPYEPLPSISMHAPTLVKYPPRTTSTSSSCCQIEEDVTLGCHQGALFDTKKFPNTSYDIASNLSFRRIYDYLLEEGCDLNFNTSSSKKKYNHRIYQPTIEDCIELCRTELRRGKELDITSKRLTHDITGRNRTIIRRGGRSSSSKKASATKTNEKEDESTITTNYQYLNKQHEQLEMKLLAKRKTNNESEGNGNGNNKNNNNNNNAYQLDFQDGIIMCGGW